MIATNLKSILLVDDDTTTNFLNKVFIDKLDHDLGIDIALNGQEAIDILDVNIQESDFGDCLIVLDLNMPYMDGWEFLEFFNENFEPKIKDKISIVVLTAVEVDPVTTKDLKELSVKDIVQKPLSEKAFEKLIGEYLNR
ncbi:CheY-like chemotaxis protein [Saonia flava]|uniref:CheY-like chemotaxis protein n=1 Tax=Saonia flava TaxID=523696 RepID=A0A846QS14_9FLAO|nr:response regulator [Saonia flava]NJB69987.1 CheY-like chemotaxis protein [Saonia flava]